MNSPLKFAAGLSLFLLAVVRATSCLAAEPLPVHASSVASSQTRLITVGERSLEVAVDALSNPLLVARTDLGDFVVELFPQEAPQNVANLVGWATGTKPFMDPSTGTEVQRPFYDGLKIHRVVANFMIQSGSYEESAVAPHGPLTVDEISAASLGLDKMLVLDAAGVPNPVLGIRNQQDFQQRVLKPLYLSMGITNAEQLAARITEVERSLKSLSVMKIHELSGYHYRNELQSHAPVRGAMVMASKGPDGNGSQFFINLVDTPWLTGKHTVVGKVRLGMEVVDAIGKVKVDEDNHPLQAISLLSVLVL